MDEELPPDLARALRALAQPADIQARLFPAFACAPDELVDHWGEAWDAAPAWLRERNRDLAEIDAIIRGGSGRLELWTDEALQSSAFWRDLRLMALDAVMDRGLPSMPPAPNGKVYISFPVH